MIIKLETLVSACEFLKIALAEVGVSDDKPPILDSDSCVMAVITDDHKARAPMIHPDGCKPDLYKTDLKTMYPDSENFGIVVRDIFPENSKDPWYILYFL